MFCLYADATPATLQELMFCNIDWQWGKLMNRASKNAVGCANCRDAHLASAPTSTFSTLPTNYFCGGRLFSWIMTTSPTMMLCSASRLQTENVIPPPHVAKVRPERRKLAKPTQAANHACGVVGLWLRC